MTQVTHSRVRLRLLVAVLAAITLGGSTLSVPTASADPADAFYLPPSSIPQQPGTVIKSRPWVAELLPVPGAVIDAKTSLVMFTSTNSRGEKQAQTGTVMVPTRAWGGKGERPLVVLGSGTIGAGDQCAPSKLIRFGQSYEQAQIALFLARGYAVAMPDYEGLGTPGDHPYLNRKSLGQSMLDMGRAARRAQFGLSPKAPVALWGYSEGGKASGSAAELAASYAPDLQVKAAYAGAPAPDLNDLARLGDGSVLGGGVGWVVNGFIASYPQHKDEFLAPFNAFGLNTLERANKLCAYDAPVLWPFVPTTAYTKDGRAIADYLKNEPWRTAVEDQRLGKVAPAMPVAVSQSDGDDIVAVAGTNRMIDGWRKGGADVTTYSLPLPPILPKTAIGHVAAYLAFALPAMDWLDKRIQ